MQKKITFIPFIYSLLIYVGICLFPFDRFINSGMIIRLIRITLLIIFFSFILYDNRNNNIFKGKRLDVLFLPLLISSFSNYFILLFNDFTFNEIDALELVQAIILFSLIALIEEVIFRYLFLDSYINRYKNKKYVNELGIILSSLLFSLCHLINAFSLNFITIIIQMLYSFCLGIVLSIIRLESRLSYAICGHILFNVFNGVLFDYLFTFTDVSNSYIIINVLIGILSIVYVFIVYYVVRKRRKENVA